MSLPAVSNVTVLPVVRSTFTEAWDALPDTMRRRSEGRSKMQPLWNSHAKLCGGHEALMEALRAYLKGDKDIARSGGPGLGPWLRQRRYEHWLGVESPTACLADKFPDERIRAAVVAVMTEGWTRSYLDPCDLEGTTLIVKTDIAIKKLGEQKMLFRRLGLTGMRKR